MSTLGEQSKPQIGLGVHSARGLVYLLAGTSVIKGVNFVTQLILLWLLGRTDFGIVTLAYTITAFIQVIEQAGVGDVLVRRRRFRMWAAPGFWFALALGALSCGLIVLSAPVAAWVYGHNSPEDRAQLFWVLIVLAPSSVTNALAVIPRAQLMRELRFRALAAVNVANMTLQKVLTVLLAYLGFGPFSFVVPTPIAGVVVAAVLWWRVRPPWGRLPRVRYWQYLVGDSTRLLVADFGRVLHDQSDYILLGIFRSVAQVGVYAVGFLYSVQIVQLLMTNLTSILFPTFLRLNDNSEKQFQAFLRSQRILAMIGVSGSLLQAATARPIAHLLFPERWYESIPIIQILSVSMATRMMSGASVALLKSQGRFATILWIRWAVVAIQVAALTVILAGGGSIVAVAIAVAVIGSVVGPTYFYASIRPYGAGWATVYQVLARPAICGALSAGTAWWIAQQMQQAGFGNSLQLVETALVAVALNAVLAWVWMRPVCSDLLQKLRQIMPRRAVA